jgi:hypothetical protein
VILSQSCLHPSNGCGCLRLAVGSGFTGALPRRWLRVKQVAWRRVGGSGDAELLEFAGDFEGNLESLLVVEPWVDVGLVGFTEV